jgi:triphosphoribosyl-dephospho-CoA synthetase
METVGMTPEEAFEKLRFRGRTAEQEMYDATGGVNTHKGAIFSLGLLCGAAGRLSGQERNAQQLLQLCSEMVRGITDRELRQQNKADTNGKRLYSHYGVTGIRGQAENGFPAVLEHGLPVFRAGIAKGLSVNDAGCAALLHLIANTQDTNLMARSDLLTQQQLAAELGRILEKEPYPGAETLQKLDREYTERNLSPGGSADLLAVTYFLHFLEQEE